MQYTKKEITKLKKMWNEGIVVKDIAKAFPNRSVNSITAKIYALRTTGEIDGRTKKTRKETKKDKRAAKKHPSVNPYELIGKSYTDYFNKHKRPETPQESTSMKIINTMEEIKLFLIKKNDQYGDSALEPIRIFSKADKSEQLKVRIDDKLNRLVQGNANIESDTDVVKDLIGYLVLLLIQMKDD
jgi:hypothetical protein